MYYTKLRMQNFARYIDAEITFDPGFNAIIGQTDSGKSSILRAIIWVQHNRPIGMGMRRDGTQETRVTLWTSTGHEVTRLRSDNRNAYILNGVTYDTVRNDVPEEVKLALGIDLAELGPRNTEMLSVSQQMDGPFMLAGSGGDAAKILGNLSGITTLDAALSGLRPDLTDISSRLKAIDKAEQSYAIACVEFEDLAREEQRLARANELLKTVREKQDRSDKLQRITKLMKSYNEHVGTLDSKIHGLHKKLEVKTLLRDAHMLAKRQEATQAIITKMNQYNSLRQQNHQQLQKTVLNLDQARKDRKQFLHDIGNCPTCGNKV